MWTVTELSQVARTSVRTLHHYDSIGLLKPTRLSEAGYRLYDEAALARLQLILLYRELDFSLKEIGVLLDVPDAERNRILEARITQLEQKQEHLKNQVFLAKQIKTMGVKHMDFESFDGKKLDERAAQAKMLWGKTDAYREWEQKSRGKSRSEIEGQNGQVMAFFFRLGALRGQQPDSEAVQTWVRDLQAFFTEHFYTCTPEVLRGLGRLYGEGGSFTENIDAAGGPGTGQLAQQAIEVFCSACI